MISSRRSAATGTRSGPHAARAAAHTGDPTGDEPPLGARGEAAGRSDVNFALNVESGKRRALLSFPCPEWLGLTRSDRGQAGTPNLPAWRFGNGTNVHPRSGLLLFGE